jgi:hypothetical protein
MYVAITVSWRVDRSAAVAEVAVPASAGSRMASPVMGAVAAVVARSCLFSKILVTDGDQGPSKSRIQPRTSRDLLPNVKTVLHVSAIQ